MDISARLTHMYELFPVFRRHVVTKFSWLFNISLISHQGKTFSNLVNNVWTCFIVVGFFAVAFFKKLFLDYKVNPFPQNQLQEFLLAPCLHHVIPNGFKNIKKARIFGSKVSPKTPTLQTLDWKLWNCTFWARNMFPLIHQEFFAQR